MVLWRLPLDEQPGVARPERGLQWGWGVARACSWEGLSHAPAPAAWSPSPRQQPDARSVAEGVQGDHFVGLLFAARAPISRPHPLCILTVKQLDQKKVRRGASVLTHSRRRIT